MSRAPDQYVSSVPVWPGMVLYVYVLFIREAEAGGSPALRPAWVT